MFFHFYWKTVLLYFPDTNKYLLRGSVIASVVVVLVMFLENLRRSVMASKRRRLEKRKSGNLGDRTWSVTVFETQDKVMNFLESVRIFLAKWILPQSHLIAAVVVLLVSGVILSTFGLWFAYAFSDEIMYIYHNISHLIRTVNNYLNSFSVYTHYVDKAYHAVSEWVSSMVLADSASAKTRALYDYIAYMSAHTDLFLNLPAVVSQCQQGAGLFRDFCSLDTVKFGTVNQLGNATLAIVSAVNQDMDTLMENPYAPVQGFWELVDYYQEELQSGGTISKGGDYLLIGLNYLKQLLVHSGTISLSAIGSGFTVFTFLFDSVLQALVYLTALFLLLQSTLGFYHYTAVLLHFIDPSTMLYRAVHKALRAILLSSLKMAIFHAGLTWLLFSFFEFPLVCIPTLAAFILGLVPVVSPVIVIAIPLPLWVYAHEENVAAIFLLAVCFLVWWFVGPSIYAEIPDSSVWMTTFSVGLGISLFGARGVIIGPMIATIPFALYGLASNYISSGAHRSLLSNPRISATPTRNSVQGRDRLMSGDFPSGAVVRSKRRKSRGPPEIGIEQLIKGSDREKLFDYIMTTPRHR